MRTHTARAVAGVDDIGYPHIEIVCHNSDLAWDDPERDCRMGTQQDEPCGLRHWIECAGEIDVIQFEMPEEGPNTVQYPFGGVARWVEQGDWWAFDILLDHLTPHDAQ